MEVLLPDVGAVDVGVDLGRRDVGVAEDLLDDAQVGAAGQHVGGEGVAQRVRVEVRHADGAAGLGDEGVHALAREPAAARVEEHGRSGLRVRADELGAPALEVVAQRAQGGAEMGAMRSLFPLPTMCR